MLFFSGGFLVYRQHRDKLTTSMNFREAAPQFTDAAAIASNVSSHYFTPANKLLFYRYPSI